MKLTIVYHP